MYQPPSSESSHLSPLYIKSASIGEMFNISYWLWRLNPSSIFPIMLSSTFDVLKESIIVIALMYSLSQLASIGILRTIAEAIRGLDFNLIALTFYQIAPQIIFTIAALIGLFFIVSIVTSSFLNSAEYGSYLYILQTGKLSILNILNEIRKRWTNMIWTVFIVELIKYGPLILTALWILFDILSLPLIDINSLLFNKFLIWLIIILPVLVVTLVLTFLTIYSYPAAAMGSYGFTAIRESIKACTKIPLDTIAYAFLRLVSNVLIVAIAFITALLGIQISSIAVILTNFIIVPVFHILKTGLFLKTQPSPDFAPLPIGSPILRDVFQYVWKTGFEKTKRGFSELMNFLAETRNIVFHIFSILIFSMGIVLGKYLSSLGIREIINALASSQGKINPLFSTYGLPFLALDISFHNWQVSLAMALSGIIFMFPTITTLIFNGFILGVVEDTTQNITMFLAAILPHGIIELPSFIIAGSVGLKLGLSFIRALKNGSLIFDSEFSNTLKRTIYIVLGLLPLFIIAGIVETFITPYVMHLYGWK